MCDVYSEQHKTAYLEHCSHSAAITELFYKYAGSGDVNMSRGVRMIIHSRLDSVDLHDDNRGVKAVIIGGCESALMPPADFKLYNIIGKRILRGAICSFISFMSA